jgi:hypothetical protein
MRMPAEIALPGVQHGGDGELGAKPFWVAAEFEKRLGGAGQEHVEHRRAMAPADGAKRSGQREDDVEVVCRQYPSFALGDPARLSQRLALGTVPVAA